LWNASSDFAFPEVPDLLTNLIYPALPPAVGRDRDRDRSAARSPSAQANQEELDSIQAQILALQQRADALRGDDEKKIKVARPQAGSQAERDGGVIEKGGAIYIDFDEDEIE